MRRFYAANVYFKPSDLCLQVAVEAESIEVARTKAAQQHPVLQSGVAKRILGRINNIVEIGQGEYEIMNRFAICCA